MDRLDAMRIFTRVVERRSFTLAARDVELPRSTVTDAVKQLETRLGIQLLQRTTRHVSPTLDGESYRRRCLSCWPTSSAPVSLLYPRNRQPSPRVRVFIDWVAREFAAHTVRP